MLANPNSIVVAIGKRLTWADVSTVHKSRSGIFHRNGRLISLLTDFGRINPCYPDFHGALPGSIEYTGSGRRGDQKLDSANRALHAAIDSGHAVPLFNKIAVNHWEYFGHWRVLAAKYVFDETRNRMVWRFTLQIDASEELRI